MRTVISPSLINRPAGHHYNDHERWHVISCAHRLLLVKTNQMESANRAARSLPYQDDTHTPQTICHKPPSSVTIKVPIERSARTHMRESSRETDGKGRKGKLEMKSFFFFFWRIFEYLIRFGKAVPE